MGAVTLAIAVSAASGCVVARVVSGVQYFSFSFPARCMRNGCGEDRGEGADDDEKGGTHFHHWHCELGVCRYNGDGENQLF